MNIPRGVSSGARLRIRHHGHAGVRGGSRGDLYVRVKVPTHDETGTFSRREGSADVHSEETISYLQAILGGTVSVRTVDGDRVDVSLSPGVQPLQSVLLRGRGAHKLDSDERGDAVVAMRVIIPAVLDAKEKELLEALAVHEREKKRERQKS